MSLCNLCTPLHGCESLCMHKLRPPYKHTLCPFLALSLPPPFQRPLPPTSSFFTPPIITLNVGFVVSCLFLLPVNMTAFFFFIQTTTVLSWGTVLYMVGAWIQSDMTSFVFISHITTRIARIPDGFSQFSFPAKYKNRKQVRKKTDQWGKNTDFSS